MYLHICCFLHLCMSDNTVPASFASFNQIQIRNVIWHFKEDRLPLYPKRVSAWYLISFACRWHWRTTSLLTLQTSWGTAHSSWSLSCSLNSSFFGPSFYFHTHVQIFITALFLATIFPFCLQFVHAISATPCITTGIDKTIIFVLINSLVQPVGLQLFLFWI